MINILNTQYDSEYDDQCMDCPELNTEKTMAEVNHQCAVYVTCQRYHERFVSRRWRLMKLAVAVGICVWFLTITFLYYKHYDKSTKGKHCSTIVNRIAIITTRFPIEPTHYVCYCGRWRRSLRNVVGWFRDSLCPEPL